MLEKAPPLDSARDSIPLMVELSANGILSDIQEKYLYWDKLKYAYNQYDAHALWNAVKLHRWIKGKSLQFGQYVFHYVITNSMLKTLHELDLHVGGNLSSNVGISETDSTKFLISSIMEEAISSSQIEGANTTRLRAKTMIRQAHKPQDVSEQMILNSFLTMKHISDHKKEQLSPETLLRVHRLITDKTLENNQEAGKFRQSNDVNVVDTTKGEIVHIPPSHEEVPKLIEDLCRFFNEKQTDFVHPIIKGCVLHFMIAWIHPFTDGNGRTARAIFYWYMLKNNYWLTQYLAISTVIKKSKSQYEKAYRHTEFDGNDLSYFIHYHLRAIEKAFAALKEYIRTKQLEVFQAAQYMHIPSMNDRMAQVVKLLSTDPERILSVKEIESRFSVSNFTARQDLKKLVQLGLLDAVAVNKKKVNYLKSKQFDQRMDELIKAS